jgi:hypothetical protein
MHFYEYMIAGFRVVIVSGLLGSLIPAVLSVENLIPLKSDNGCCTFSLSLMK